MKILVLASALGALTSALVVPAVGPVHYALTRPYSMFSNTLTVGGPDAILGTPPLDFVMTDITVSRATNFDGVTIKVNGSPVFCLPAAENGYVKGGTHLTTGIFIPAGATVTAEATGVLSQTNSITVAGYVQ